MNTQAVPDGFLKIGRRVENDFLPALVLIQQSVFRQGQEILSGRVVGRVMASLMSFYRVGSSRAAQRMTDQRLLPMIEVPPVAQ